MATLGLIISVLVGRNGQTKADQIINFFALALTTVGMLVTIINHDPDDGGPFNTAWWIEETIGLVDFSLAAAGFIFDAAFMHP